MADMLAGSSDDAESSDWSDDSMLSGSDAAADVQRSKKELSAKFGKTNSANRNRFTWSAFVFVLLLALVDVAFIIMAWYDFSSASKTSFDKSIKGSAESWMITSIVLSILHFLVAVIFWAMSTCADSHWDMYGTQLLDFMFPFFMIYFVLIFAFDNIRDTGDGSFYKTVTFVFTIIGGSWVGKMMYAIAYTVNPSKD